jgi:uncharacterized membrane protein YkvA (DUF1232 family)
VLACGVVKKFAKRIGFWGEAAAIGVALLDKRTPLVAKLISAASLFYLVDPLDLAPDFIPVIGWADDLLITPLVFMLASRFIPRAVMDDARNRFTKKIQQAPKK